MVKNPTIAHQLSDESLMKLALGGESRAFENLYDRYSDKLLRYVYRFVEDKHLAEDLVQETFLKLLEKPEAFDLNRKFSTWVYTVAGNLCRNQLRNSNNRRRLNEGLMEEESQDQSRVSHDKKLLQMRIQTLFGSLNEKEQEVFVLRFELDLSIREIADIMGIPEGSVKSCLFYLLKKMAPQLNEFRYG